MIKLTDEVISKIANGDTDVLYHTKKWQDKRNQILERDHYECQRCIGRYRAGREVKHIRIIKANTVHHKQEVRDRIDLILDDDNLVSLCHACHDEVHGRTPFKFNKAKPKLTPERW